MQEKRRLSRNVISRSAKIALDNSSPLECIVRNLTGRGACLEIPALTDVPNSLELSFDNFRSIRSCRVIWRNAETVGVCFYQP
jgi:hypothetical protein